MDQAAAAIIARAVHPNEDNYFRVKTQAHRRQPCAHTHAHKFYK